MDHSTTHFVSIVMTFFAVMNPMANTPIFLGLTEGFAPGAKRWVAVRSVVLAFGIVSLFAIFGHGILTLFGITLAAFRIAGGILVGLVGFHLLQGKNSSVHTPQPTDLDASHDAMLGISVSPLAMPILAGPGTIAAAMNFSANGGMSELLRVEAAFGIACLLTLIAFLAGDWLMRVVGRNFLMVISRLMGLILAVIGAQMLIAGIQSVRAMGGAG